MKFKEQQLILRVCNQLLQSLKGDSSSPSDSFRAGNAANIKIYKVMCRCYENFFVSTNVWFKKIVSESRVQ